MGDAALRALRDWTPSLDIPNVVPTANVPPKLEHNASGPGSFVARASFQLPDGGRFSLLLSGGAGDEALMPLVEDELGLPDGFLIDINAYLLGELTIDGPLSPEKLVGATLKRANRLYEKQVFTAPREVKAKKDASPESTAPLGTPFSLKRKRSAIEGYTPPEFGHNRLATTTLMKQITLLKEMDTRKDGFVAEPMEDDLYMWNVNLYFDDVDASTIAADLAALPQHDAIKLEFRFPSEYPAVPPIVRVVSPHVIGGHVAPHGGICMELLTTSGWAPVNSIDVVCIQIRAMLIQGRARIDPVSQYLVANYTFSGAMNDLKHIVTRHQWNVAQRRPRKLPS